MNIDSLRADFPILSRRVHGRPLVYLDNAATTHKPRSVIDRVSTFYAFENGGTHRSTHVLARESAPLYENARERVRAFLNAASSSEIIFTRGTTESINLVACSFGELFVHKDDEVVVTEMEHHSNLLPWQRLCERSGARMRLIPIDKTGALQVDALEQLINDRTRLIAVAHASNVTGIVNEVSEIISIAHSHDIPVLIDGAQAVSHVPVDVADLDCDFYAFSGHKIYAETGIGVLYGKRRWLDAMPPYQSGGGMIASATLEGSLLENPPFRFEAGTPNVAGALSLATAIEYLSKAGLKRIARHEEELLCRLETGLLCIKGTTLHGDAPRRCGSLSFNLDGIHHSDAGMVLDSLGIAVRTGTLCAEPYVKAIAGRGTIRASVALYNSEEEIDRLLEAVERAASLLRLKGASP